MRIFSMFWALVLVLAILMPFGAKAATCLSHSTKIEVDLSTQRKASEVILIPATIFGFNIPWLNFQEGYVDNGGNIKSEVIEWLLPFRGAILRYPGGTPSSWFEWRKSLGSIAKREPIHYTRGRVAPARFGVGEFMALANSLKAVPLFVLNLSGPFNGQWSDDQLDREAREFALYLKKTLPSDRLAPCDDDARRCASVVIELGNEMDWPPFSWSAEQYTHRAEIVALAFQDILPSAIVTSHLTTAPWAISEKARGLVRADFSSVVPRNMANLSDAYAFHPFYDGATIPTMHRYLDDLGVAVHRSQPPKRFHLYITEYGRWPNKVLGHDWREQWHLTEDMSGTLSNGDFLLSLMPRSEVRGAALHALGTSGPWQIIRKDRNSGVLYPTAVYWGMRAIREATFDTLVAHGTVGSRKPEYARSYDARFAVTESTDRNMVGITIVNRSHAPLMLVLNDKAGRFANSIITTRVVAGRDRQHEHNNDSDHTAVVVERRDIELGEENQSSGKSRILCISGRSISTFSLKRAAR